MKDKFFKIIGISLIFSVLIFAPIYAQKDSLTLFETLAQQDILNLHIKTNLRQLIRKKAKKENHAAIVTYTDKYGQQQEWNIKIRARGNMRNKICFLPPLKLNFVKSDLRAAGILGEFDDLKLVVRCKTSDAYDKYILREYLAYKLYNTLTEFSFRVKLAKITLEDVEGKQKNIETYAFLIENEDEMAARAKGKIVDLKYMKQDILDPELFDKMCVFQFMIGNTDWHIFNKHNVKVIKTESPKMLVAVPYDFDYSGMVSAPYAAPQEKLPLERVQDRFFLGICREKGSYEPILQELRDKKAVLMASCEVLTPLEKKHQRSTVSWLQEFFEILDNPKICQEMIIEHCDKYVKVSK